MKSKVFGLVGLAVIASALAWMEQAEARRVCVPKPWPLSGKVCQDVPDVIPVPPVDADELWGEAGRVAIPAAAISLRDRNINLQSYEIFPEWKRLLRAKYGNLVDSTYVVLHARLTDKYCAATTYCIHLGSVDTAAQTFGNRIYKTGGWDRRSLSDFLTIAHELQHTQQQSTLGLPTFGYRYFKSFKQVSRNYNNISFELEAESQANWFKERVINSPNGGLQWK
jgi:hypothetical protein